jgi:hypothetical protein
MSTHFGAGESKASFVELVSNSLVLSGIELESDLAQIFAKPGFFPYDRLFALIHESAHRYCFLMPVGNAISACFLESTRAHMVGDAKRSKEAFARYKIVVHALRPIAEGIALYAEFDAFPGSSRAAISPVLTDALQLFSEALPEHLKREEHTCSDRLKTLLTVYRSLDIFANRREAVIGQSCIDDADGYLAGYILVKNYRLHLLDRQTHDSLFDTDFYFQLIANYFYADLALATLIMDFDNYSVGGIHGELGDCADFTDALYRHLHHKLQHLTLGEMSNDVARIESVLASTDGYNFDDVQISTEYLPFVDYSEYSHRLLTFSDRFCELPDAKIGPAMVELLNDRRWTTYASFSSELRVTENGRFFVGEGALQGKSFTPVLMGTVADNVARPQHGLCQIECVKDPSDRLAPLTLLVWLDNQLIAALGPCERYAYDELPSRPSAHARHFAQSLTNALDACLTELNPRGTVVQEYLNGAKQKRRDILGTFLSVFVWKHGAPCSDEDMSAPFSTLCDDRFDALMIAARAGHWGGGIVLDTSAILSEEDIESLMSCPVQIATRRGNATILRI